MTRLPQPPPPSLDPAPRDPIQITIEPGHRGLDGTEDLRVTGTTIRTDANTDDSPSNRTSTAMTHDRTLARVPADHRDNPIERDAYEPLAHLLRGVGPHGLVSALTELTGPHDPPALSVTAATVEAAGTSTTQLEMQGTLLLELKRPGRSRDDLRAQLQRHIETAEHIRRRTGQPATVILIAGFDPPSDLLENFPTWVHAVHVDSFLHTLLFHADRQGSSLRPTADYISSVLRRPPRTGDGVWTAEWLPADLVRQELRTILPIDLHDEPVYLLTANDLAALPLFSGTRAVRQILSVIEPLTSSRETLYPVEDVMAYAKDRGALRGDIPRSSHAPWRLRGLHTATGITWLWHESQLRKMLRDTGLQRPLGALPDINPAWQRGLARFYETEPVLRWCDEQSQLRDAITWMTQHGQKAAA